MRTIFISAGHSDKLGRDRGAVGNGYIEGVETVKVRKRIVEILKNKYNCKVVIDVDDSIFSQTLAYFRNKVCKESLLIDIHFNAATPQATGTESFVPREPTQIELELAYALSHVASVNFNVNKRGSFKSFSGVKNEIESHHKKLSWMTLQGHNVLLELCFITNARDMSSYIKNFENYCQDVALILFKFATNKEKEILNKI